MSILPYFSFGVSVLACVIAALVAVRAGKWRETDEAKALIQRVSNIEGVVATHTERFTNVPTMADMAGVAAKLDALAHAIDKTERGVERIEGFLMENAK